MPETQPASAKHWRLVALKFSLAVVLIWAMIHFRMLDPHMLAKIGSKPWHLAGASLLLLIGLLLTVARWRALLAVQGINIGPLDAGRLGFIGFFFSCVIPGAVSGDAVKAYYVAREHGKTTEAITSVLLDRVIGLYTMAAAASIAIVICWRTGSFPDAWAKPGIVMIAWLVIGLAVGMSVFFLIVLSHVTRENRLLDGILRRLPFREQLTKLHDAIYRCRDHKRALASIILLSFAAQVPMVLFNFVVGKALGDGGLSLAMYFFLASVGLVINSIPVLPGGLGTGELGYAMLFGAFGSPAGAEIIAVWHVLFLGWSIPGLAFYISRRRAAAAAGAGLVA